MEVLADRYELAEPLGSGGMAEVTAAYDRVLDRRVAVKLIRGSKIDDPVGRERFWREARAAARLSHANTVGVYDFGEDAGRPFIVMELVEGPSLADRLRDQGRLPVTEVVRLGAAVLSGLNAAHRRGLVHRDVKPSNILLPAEGGVKLADFGIATDGGAADLTSAGQVVGTPRYLAPERAAGQPATPASDVYAVGAIMYECLAGRPVFRAGDAPAVGRRTPSLADAVPGAPAGVAAVVDRALADDPVHRFGNARAMRHALAASGLGAMPASPAAPEAEAQGASAAPAADTTQVMAVPRARRRMWPAVVGALGVLAVLVAALYLLDRDTSGNVAALPSQDPVQEPVDEQPSPSEDAGEETPEEVVELDQLIDVLAADPSAAGEKGEDLLDELRDLQSEPDSDEARELIKKVAEWMAKGELDAELGEQAIAVLEQESRPDADKLVDASALLAHVATTMPEWGDKGKDLHSKLTKLLETEAPGKQAKEARDLIDEIEKWVEEGKIDAERAEDAISVLEPLTQPG